MVLNSQRYRLPAAAALLAILAGGCGSDSMAPVQGSVARVVLSADSVRFWVGDTARVEAEVRASDGTPLDVRVRWETTTTAVEVDAEGLLSAVGRGAGVLRATASDALPAEIPIASLPIISGRVHGTAGEDIALLYAVWRAGETADTVSVGADGRFVILAGSVEPEGELLIDSPSPPRPRAFHPFLFPFEVDSLSDVQVVVVPRAWTIRQGIYQGQTVDISLNRVMDETENMMPAYYMGGRGYPETHIYQLQIRYWEPDAFPVSVVIDHRNSDPPFTEADSVRLWAVLDRMQEIFGRPLYEPGQAEPDWWEDPDSREPIAGVVRVLNQPQIIGGADQSSTESALVWRRNLGAWAADGVFREFEVLHQRADAGGLYIGNVDTTGVSIHLGHTRVVNHEMMHILGVGHGCPFPTTQSPCPGVYEEPTRDDVAHVELLWEIAALEREHGTFLGFIPSLIGERRRLLGLPALPEFGFGAGGT